MVYAVDSRSHDVAALIPSSPQMEAAQVLKRAYLESFSHNWRLTEKQAVLFVDQADLVATREEQEMPDFPAGCK